ncbi:uncharacterized protein K460DRAFT_22889 [Cucurbitaria berberidis CBS 394.84]|uniref:Uncharacterized protein n=1 Tax=Cucurbitaria berberidis CBS 394.84 TaxID=1168544 RepID=A0A9P4GTN3_9PLEO|nr:uncharacterized protein K460DRAFT_22889 [Cucurbitaria berberidis CBS 394.84]KAF1850856.1 hypothetical protein K460DRAFT_22889 [Cucurbitaria berberidis CBS 394.84]
MDTVFRGALIDPALFHALSLVLALAAYNNLPNIEILTYRGELLNGLNTIMRKPGWKPKVSSITAMLMLISYEYRVDGANCDSIRAHIQGVQAIMNMCQAEDVTAVDQVQRALFWQDLISCLVLGTSRLLSHNCYQEFRNLRIVNVTKELPLGFLEVTYMWHMEFAAVVQDLTGLCTLVDKCDPTRTFIDELPIDDSQANIESRLVDLLSESRSSPACVDSIYEACIFATYLCTYNLSTGIWMGCFVPEVCVSRIIGCVTEAVHDPLWDSVPGLLLWLLCVSGGLTERKDVRKQVTVLIQSVFLLHMEGIHQDWHVCKGILRNYVWSERAMERKIFRVWKDLHPESSGALEARDELGPLWSCVL